MKIYGRLSLLIGALTGIPLAVIPFYPDEARYAPAFLLPMAASIALGLILNRLAAASNSELMEWKSSMQKGSLPVLFVWGYSFLTGAIPFVLGKQLRFIPALFEAVSGWTTTGLTVVNTSGAPHIFLFHRSFMQYCGGLGFIIMMSIVVQNKQSVNLYNAEGHYDRLLPNLKKTSRVIALMYGGLLVFGASLYRLFGMEMFDAVCHAMSALSTAGFSTQENSIGAYASTPIELVTILLMLIGASNFAVLMLFARGKFRNVMRISEARFMLGLTVVFTVPCALSLIRHTGLGIGDSFVKALFGVTAVFSTTGYSAIDYASWPPFAMTFLLPLMLIGGCAGSTSGGIKMSRVYLLIRATRENIRKRVSSARRVTAPSYYTVRGKTPIDDALIMDTAGFIASYLGIIIIGTLLVAFTANCTPERAMYEFASAFGTVGISNGLTASANNATLIVEMAGMILGRLEIFIVFIGFYEVFRTVRRRIGRYFRSGRA